MTKGIVVEPQELGEGLGVRAVAGIARGAVQNVHGVRIIRWCPRHQPPPRRYECKESLCGRTVNQLTDLFWSALHGLQSITLAEATQLLTEHSVANGIGA